MRRRIAAVLLFAVGSAMALQAQTQKELDTRYPPSSYEVWPGVMMTPKFAADDQVCEMTFRASPIRRNGVRTNGLLHPMDIEMIKQMWVEEGTTGEPLNGAGGSAKVAGDVRTTRYEYKKATMIVNEKASDTKAGATSVFVKVKNRACKPEPVSGKRELRSPFNLLPGYKMKYGSDFEGRGYGDIWKGGGPSIHFVLGGHFASDVEGVPAEKIAWREELTWAGSHFQFVYTKEQKLVATVGGRSNGNFEAKIGNEQQLAEVLMTILSLDEVRGYPTDPARMEGVR